jgi:hypothetical protein
VLPNSRRRFDRFPGAHQGVVNVFFREFHFTRRLAALAVVALPLLAIGGCAMFHKEFWNIDNYRDERAVDVDHRLEHSDTGVKDPF